MDGCLGSDAEKRETNSFFGGEVKKSPQREKWLSLQNQWEKYGLYGSIRVLVFIWSVSGAFERLYNFICHVILYAVSDE